jgi:hypothetical protein
VGRRHQENRTAGPVPGGLRAGLRSGGKEVANDAQPLAAPTRLARRPTTVKRKKPSQVGQEPVEGRDKGRALASIPIYRLLAILARLRRRPIFCFQDDRLQPGPLLVKEFNRAAAE